MNFNRDNEPIVWADEASPFTGDQVLSLLRENDRLRKMNRRLLEACKREIIQSVCICSLLRAISDKDGQDDVCDLCKTSAVIADAELEIVL